MSYTDKVWQALEQIASGDGSFTLETPAGEIKAQLLPLPDGSIGLFDCAGIIEGEVVTDSDYDMALDWLTAGPGGRALPLPPEWITT